MYLLSNLRLTDSEVDYIMDLINVYFNIESKELPQLGVGIRTYLPTSDKTVISDLVSEDISKFISLLSKQGINLTLESISNNTNKINIVFRYNDQSINVSLER